MKKILHQRIKQDQHGFTLLELVSVIAILVIIAAIAVPNYNSTMQKQETKKFSQQFKSSLILAREKAFVSGRATTVCAVADTDASTLTCLEAWDKLNNESLDQPTGWIVFFDADKDGAYTPPPKDDNGKSVDKLYKKTPYHSNKTAIKWTNGGKITVAPRGSTGNMGTLRIYTPSLGSLASWNSKNPPEINKSINEIRVALTSLGKVSVKEANIKK